MIVDDGEDLLTLLVFVARVTNAIPPLIDVVAGFWAVVLIRQRPHARNLDASERIKLLQRLQEVRTICKTRNQLDVIIRWTFHAQ
jgi:hypothetical protein